MPDREVHRCICGSSELLTRQEFSSLARVTSDCRPWPSGGSIGVCGACGFVRKPVDEDFIAQSRQIYDAYAVYHQGDGQEQQVFDQQSGISQDRSRRLLERILNDTKLKSEGRLLDIGCGNGNLLKSFATLMPHWKMCGSELDTRNKQTIESIENVEAFYSCDIDGIPGSYDLISMVHCLEHIHNPVEFVRKLRQKLSPDGLVIIETPDFENNPFDLVIADHCNHFDAHSLRQVFNASGFEIITLTNEYVPREFTLVARVRGETDAMNAPNRSAKDISSVQALLERQLNWLTTVKNKASEIAQAECMGVFGTSVAGTWLWSELADSIRFFVDEDTHRAGRTHMDKDVYLPADAPAESNVFVALPTTIANKIYRRLNEHCNANLILPSI